MEIVVLIIHLLLAISIVGLVLIQRSEGGGLGIGGSGGGGLGGITTAGGTKNLLTRSTAIVTAAFFTTSLILGILAGGDKLSGQEGLLNAIENTNVPAIEKSQDEIPPNTEIDPLPSVPKE